jgi:hypothetical protein
MVGVAKAEKHLRLRAGHDLGLDSAPRPGQLERLGVKRRAHVARRRVEQDSLERAPGEQPVKPPVAAGGQQDDRSDDIGSYLWIKIGYG